MEGLLTYLHTLAIGTLVGKVVCLSFVVAPVLAKTLEPESFSKVVRKLFPAYYLLGMGATGLGLISWGANRPGPWSEPALLDGRSGVGPAAGSRGLLPLSPHSPEQ
ncbi:MAG: hypothetical protein UZ03_NOB001001031 [Nitrospira sp. OLB3]|nr:MAG: hypothetical protein UZ03_NOB001001031 [Nitrospira sp. OLB3]